jgi:hypothetical protein
MDTSFKEVVASTADESLTVFVRTSTRELTLDDLELVAGGRGARIVPDG